jgi:hypothetical protein
MGYNTACLILNDRLHDIAKDPNAGAKIQTAILCAARDQNKGPAGFYTLQSQHADIAQIVVISANSIKEIGYGHWRDSQETLLRKLADQHGFRLVKKPIKKVS